MRVDVVIPQRRKVASLSSQCLRVVISRCRRPAPAGRKGSRVESLQHGLAILLQGDAPVGQGPYRSESRYCRRNLRQHP